MKVDLVSLDLLDLLVQVDLRAVLDHRDRLELPGLQEIQVQRDRLGRLDHKDNQDPQVGQGSRVPQVQRVAQGQVDKQDFKAELVRNLLNDTIKVTLNC